MIVRRATHPRLRGTSAECSLGAAEITATTPADTDTATVRT